jgi:CheY-like chemotaxis protein
MLESAAGTAKPFDAVLVDLQMPELDGFGLAREIQAGPAKTVPLILMTPITRTLGEAQARALGIRGQLTKPVRPGRLCEVLVSLTEATPEAGEIGARADDPSEEILELRVLLVEDSLVNQEVASVMLESLGCQVDVVDSGLQALDQTSNHHYDIVLMDCQMPEMNGFEATRAIRERESGEGRLPIVALTALAMREDRERCLDSGMDDCLVKPFNQDQLREMLVRWRSASEGNKPTP